MRDEVSYVKIYTRSERAKMGFTRKSEIVTKQNDSTTLGSACATFYLMHIGADHVTHSISY